MTTDTELEAEKDNDLFHVLCTPVIKRGERFNPPDWYAWVYGSEKAPCITGDKPARKAHKPIE